MINVRCHRFKVRIEPDILRQLAVASGWIISKDSLCIPPRDDSPLFREDPLGRPPSLLLLLVVGRVSPHRHTVGPTTILQPGGGGGGLHLGRPAVHLVSRAALLQGKKFGLVEWC